MPVVKTKFNCVQLTREFVFSEVKEANNVQSLAEFIHKMQYWELEKVSISPLINQSIIDHINNCYAQIPLLKNNTEFKDGLHSFILGESQRSSNNLIFCIGNSGCGKSTLLIKTFLDLSERYEDKNIIPIYLNLNNAKKFFCNRKKILHTICSRYKIKMGNNMVLNSFLNSYKFVFLLDGLDEKSTKLKYKDIERAITHRTNDTFVISCRTNTYHQLNLKDIDSLIEFKPIDAKLRIEYLNNFFVNTPLLSEKNKQIINILSESQQEENIFSNILMLTLLGTHIKESPEYILQINKKRGTIIDSIVTEIIKREIKKNNLNISIETGCEIVESVALITYERQRKGQTYLYGIMNEAIKKKMRNIDTEIIERIINIFIKTGYTKTYQFIHSQFYDLFVAKSVFNAIKKKRNLDKIMSHNFSIDINALLSDLVRDDIPDKIYDKLERLCYKYLEEVMTKQTGYEKLFLLFMHMQRTGEYEKMYVFAKDRLDSEVKYQPHIESMLFHSKVVCGLKEEDEELYFQKLHTDKNFYGTHMGTPLLYYNDELEFRLPNYDNGKIGYKNVFLAYSRHFLKSDTIKHYYIVRRHNIFTIRNYLEQRKETPQQIAEFYYSIKNAVESDNSTFGLKVKAEYDLLIESINKFPVTNNDF